MSKLKLHLTLKKLIAEHEITLRELAKKTGVPQATLSAYTAGAGTSKPEHILALSQFFKVPMETLLFGADHQPPPTLDEVLTEGVFEGWLKVRIERAIPNKRKG